MSYQITIYRNQEVVVDYCPVTNTKMKVCQVPLGATKIFKKFSSFLKNTIHSLLTQSLVILWLAEAATGGVLLGKMFLEISQNSQVNTCDRVSFLIQLQAWAWNFIKKRLWHKCFPVSFAKFLRTFFLQNTSGWLLLD